MLLCYIVPAYLLSTLHICHNKSPAVGRPPLLAFLDDQPVEPGLLRLHAFAAGERWHHTEMVVQADLLVHLVQTAASNLAVPVLR